MLSVRTLRVFGAFFLALVGMALVRPADAVTIERVTSPGGLTAWLVQDHSIPVLALAYSFTGGSALDPVGKEGLARWVAGLLTDGAGDLDDQAYQEKLEDIVASVDFSADMDTFSGSLKTLTRHRKEAVELMRLALTKPRFDPEVVERMRSRALAALARNEEQPGAIASRTWWKAAFPSHPYGRTTSGTEKSLKDLSIADFREFMATRLSRDTLSIGAVGDITPAELGLLLDEAFGGLPARAATPTATVPEARAEGVGRTIVVRKDVTQSAVVFGQDGLKRNDPDFYAAFVMNYILGGGGFNSWLLNEVREKRGLAYSVYSYLSTMERAGLILGGTASENRSVAQSLDVVRDQWRRMRDEGPTQEELNDAKTYLTGSYALQFTSTTAIARQMVSIQRANLGMDYIDRRNTFIEQVTLDDVRRVARRLLDPARLVVVVVGKPEGLAGAEIGG
ncbi:MAG: insulinase family protein [Rhodospirillaceae bacterium]|nr:insulinase family protein [Rhodospirillaceae bacterium]